MAEIIEARVKQKVDTLANWNASELLTLDGETLYVSGDSGENVISFKIGVNGKKFSELPWPDIIMGDKANVPGGYATPDKTAVLTTIAELRALSGTLVSNQYYTTDIGKEGNWYYDSTDTTSVDNTGTVLVDAAGRRWKRVYDYLIPQYFGCLCDGTTNDTTNFNKLISFISSVGGGEIRFTNGVLNLNSSNITFPSNTRLFFNGGLLKNVIFTGSDSIIEGFLEISSSENVRFRGSYKKSRAVYNYPTMSSMKTFVHWPNKVCKTNGFYYEGDGGNGEYIINLNTVFSAENQHFQPYWSDTTVAQDAGLYSRMDGVLFAKLISQTTEINAALFGVKYDANYYDSVTKRYYSDAAFTTLATDNYSKIVAAINQIQFWSLGALSKDLVISKRLIINSTLTLTHGNYGLKIRGTGYGDRTEISSNSDLNAIIENIYSSATPNALTGLFAVIQDLTFKGADGRIKNGFVVKNGYEVDGIIRCQFHDFFNAGIVLYGVSSTFKLNTVSCFRNKYGVLITSTHPYRVDGSSNPLTNVSEGIFNLQYISGDHNTDALIAIDCVSNGASINIIGDKSENNDNATVLIKKSNEKQCITLNGAFTNGDGDFLKIEDYGGELPTIVFNATFHNDTDSDNWDINDLLTGNQIRFYKNPTASFLNCVYTNAIRNYQNGFRVYRNGVKSNLESDLDYGTTPNRPISPRVNFQYFDTTLGRPIWWNGTSWVDATGTSV